MAENKDSNSGLFWLGLILIGGAAAWAISKFIVPVKDNTVQNQNNNSNTNTNNTHNNNNNNNNNTNNNGNNNNSNNTPAVPKKNLATDNGYPFSIDTKKIMTYGNKYIDPLSATNGTGFGIYIYTDTINGVSVTYNVIINNGMIFLQKSVQKNVEKNMYYPYDIETGKFLDVIANDTYTIQ